MIEEAESTFQKITSLPGEEANKLKDFAKKYRIHLSVGLIFLLIFFLIIFFIVLQEKQKEFLSPSTNLPTPIPTPETKIIPKSIYATDSAVLKIEEEILGIDKDLQYTDLKETSLNPPVLDMDVFIEENK